MGLRDAINYNIVGDKQLRGIGVTIGQISDLQQPRTIPQRASVMVMISGKRSSSSGHAIYRAHDQFNVVFLLRTDLSDANYNLYSIT